MGQCNLQIAFGGEKTVRTTHMRFSIQLTHHLTGAAQQSGASKKEMKQQDFSTAYLGTFVLFFPLQIIISYSDSPHQILTWDLYFMY